MQIGVMRDTGIREPARPDAGQGQEGFLLTCHPLIQTPPPSTHGALRARLASLAKACHDFSLPVPDQGLPEQDDSVR